MKSKRDECEDYWEYNAERILTEFHQEPEGNPG